MGGRSGGGEALTGGRTATGGQDRFSSAQLESFLRWLRESEEQLRMAQQDEQDCNAQTQDILHRLELSEDGYHETARLGKLLRRVRRKRRKAKNEIDVLSPAVAWAQENQPSVKSLERLLGALRKAEQRQAIRFYTNKTDILEGME